MLERRNAQAAQAAQADKTGKTKAMARARTAAKTAAKSSAKAKAKAKTWNAAQYEALGDEEIQLKALEAIKTEEVQ